MKATMVAAVEDRARVTVRDWFNLYRGASREAERESEMKNTPKEGERKQNKL